MMGFYTEYSSNCTPDRNAYCLYDHEIYLIYS